MIGQGEHPLFENPPVREEDMLDEFRKDIAEKWMTFRMMNDADGDDESSTPPSTTARNIVMGPRR